MNSATKYTWNERDERKRMKENERERKRMKENEREE
jgi:hypothetical protein